MNRLSDSAGDLAWSCRRSRSMPADRDARGEVAWLTKLRVPVVAWAKMSKVFDRFRTRLLGSLGLAALACGPNPGLDDEGGVTTDPSDSGTQGSSDSGEAGGTTTSSEGSGSEATSGSSEGSEVTSGMPDMPPASDCTVVYTETGVLSRHPDCPLLDDPTSCGVQIMLGCTPLRGGTCARTCNGADCIGDWTTCAGDVVYSSPSVVCGPYEIDGQCCSIGQDPLPCSDGRPFVVGREAAERRATLCTAARPDARAPAQLDTRRAARWRTIAAGEHASIASFARFVAELVAHAAPPELIADALRAMRDEVEHAELARRLAEQLGGEALAFGPLDVRGAFDELDGDARVLACVREGCIGETLSALELARAAERCPDPAHAHTLARMADDELRHAELAWRFVAWMLGRRPDLRESIAGMFAEVLTRAGEPAEPQREAIVAVLQPCVRGLLAA